MNAALPLPVRVAPSPSLPRGRLLRPPALGVYIALLCWTQAPYWGQDRQLSVIRVLVGLGYALTAAILVAQAGQRPNARLFAAEAGLWLVGQLYEQPAGALQFVGDLLGPQADILLAAIFLRYPANRLDPASRRFVVASSAWLFVTQAAQILTSTPAAGRYPDGAWAFPAGRNPVVATWVEAVAEAGMVVIAALFLALMVRRFRRTSLLDRSLLLPVAVAATAAAVLVLAEEAMYLLPGEFGTGPDWTIWGYAALRTLSNASRLAVPAAFLASATARRLSRVGVADLVVRLARPGTVGVLRDALRETLRDPTAGLYFWVPEREAYVDEFGHPTDLSEVTADRLVVPIVAPDGGPLALLVADPRLAQDPALVEAAVAAGGLALQNAQLQASVLAQLAEVELSRTRIVAAERAERRRFERDLHDGAQQRLLAVNLRLATARAQATDPAVLAGLEEARMELHRALEELRDLARGIHPAVLTEAGLGPALEAVADRLPVPVDVEVPVRRYAPIVETAVYFVVCEALTNAVKHAGPCRASVRVREVDDRLEVEIADTGAGGATVRPGSGLAGLEDRLAAVGGRLTVDGSPAGSRVRASVPCG